MSLEIGKYVIDQYLEVADFWAWETDDSLVLTYLSDGFSQLTGLEARDFIGRSRSQINKRDLDAEIWHDHRQMLERREPFRGFRYPLETPGGQIRWFESSGMPQFDETGAFTGYRGVARDITPEVNDRALLRDSARETKLQKALLAEIERVSKIGEWRWSLATDELTFSDEVCRIYELPLGSVVNGKEAFSAFDGKAREQIESVASEAVRKQQHYDVTLPFTTRKGNARWVRAIGVPEVVDGRTTRLFGTFQDVTEQREQELKMRKLAMTDALTGIANRTAFNAKLDKLVERANQSAHCFALCIIDLNHFKQINDQYGHDVGDQVLVAFTESFKANTPDDWFFARIGGDEFAVLIEGKPGAANLDAEIDLFTTAIQAEVELDAVSPVVSLTGGYALAPDHANTAKALLRRADFALYEAKRSSTISVSCYEPRMEESFDRRVMVTSDFTQALKHDQIVPYYQPVVELATGRLTGMETLVRWNHPDRGFLAAGQFMEVFDDAKLSIALTRHMLDQVCRDMACWQAAGRLFVRVGLNVTAAVLKEPGFSLRVIETLARHGLRPQQLVIEVTETTLFDSSGGQITGQLRQLRDAGALIALDDFGTGFSSLTHLKSLPFDILKIDKSFVKDMMRSPADMSIVQSLIGLGRDIGYTMVAEGIEEAAEAEHLLQIGCMSGQGYFFHRPMPKSAVDELLDAQRDAIDELGEPGMHGQRFELSSY